VPIICTLHNKGITLILPSYLMTFRRALPKKHTKKEVRWKHNYDLQFVKKFIRNLAHMTKTHVWTHIANRCVVMKLGPLFLK
jgi:hypothetical protein